jgi:hypothetical protein
MEVNIDIECPHCENEFESSIDFNIIDGNDFDYQNKELVCPKCTCEFRTRIGLSLSSDQSRTVIIKEPTSEEFLITTESNDPNQLKLF